MRKSKRKSLPKFRSLDKLVEFFETHDLGEYRQAMPTARFDVALKKRTYLVAIDAELSSKLTRIAKMRRRSSERLVNSWLREKLMEHGQA